MDPDVSIVWIGMQHWNPPYSLNMGVGAAGSIAMQFALASAMSIGRIPGVVMMSGMVTVSVAVTVLVPVVLQDAGQAENSVNCLRGL